MSKLVQLQQLADKNLQYGEYIERFYISLGDQSSEQTCPLTLEEYETFEVWRKKLKNNHVVCSDMTKEYFFGGDATYEEQVEIIFSELKIEEL